MDPDILVVPGEEDLVADRLAAFSSFAMKVSIWGSVMSWRDSSRYPIRTVSWLRISCRVTLLSRLSFLFAWVRASCESLLSVISTTVQITPVHRTLLQIPVPIADFRPIPGTAPRYLLPSGGPAPLQGILRVHPVSGMISGRDISSVHHSRNESSGQISGWHPGCLQGFPIITEYPGLGVVICTAVSSPPLSGTPGNRLR